MPYLTRSLSCMRLLKYSWSPVHVAWTRASMSPTKNQIGARASCFWWGVLLSSNQISFCIAYPRMIMVVAQSETRRLHIQQHWKWCEMPSNSSAGLATCRNKLGLISTDRRAMHLLVTHEFAGSLYLSCVLVVPVALSSMFTKRNSCTLVIDSTWKQWTPWDK